MGFLVDDKRLLTDRAKGPHYYASKDAAEHHGLAQGDVGYDAFMWLWAAKGRWHTLERMIAKPVVGQKQVPPKIASYLLAEDNRDFLNRMMAQANGLHKMYQSL